jgi:hypothetical protein
MRIWIAAFLMAIVAAAPGIEGTRELSCSNSLGLTLQYKWDLRNHLELTYHISGTSAVTSAWVELRVGSKLWRRLPVPVKAQGQVPMEYPILDFPPNSLTLGIFDADLPNYCIDFGCGKIRPGSVVSEMVIGYGSGVVEDRPEIYGDPVRLVEGSSRTDLVLRGMNLTPESKVFLIERQSGFWSHEFESENPPSKWIPVRYLEAHYIDITHIRVSLSPEDLAEPAILEVRAQNPNGPPANPSLGLYDLSQVKPEFFDTYPMIQMIYVVSKESPVLTFVEPSALSAGSADEPALVTLHGNGFTPRSRVAYGISDPLHHKPGPPDLFISPQELRIHVSAAAGPVPIWVLGDDNSTCPSR